MKKFYKFLIIFLIIFVIFAIFLLGIININKSKIYGRDIYFLCIGKFRNYNDAINYKGYVESKGAAGYILTDEIYDVIAFAYFSKNDALKVKNSLEDYSTEIVVFHIDKYKTNNIQIKKLMSCLENYIIDFYNLILEFDKNKNSGDEIENKVKLFQNDLKNFKKRIKNDGIVLSVDIILDIAFRCKDKFVNENKFTSKIKNLFINTIIETQNIVSCVNS